MNTLADLLKKLIPTQSNFAFAFLLLPKHRREGLKAAYGFCRAVDDAVDLEPDAARAIAALDGWRREVDLVFGGGQPATPQGRALQPFVGPFPLSR